MFQYICCENFLFFLKLDKSAMSVLCIYTSHKSCKLAQGRFAVGLGKHREFETVV